MRNAKKFLVSIGLASLLLVACKNKTTYESLDSAQAQIVDVVLEQQYRYSEMNGIKFSNYNGEIYFVASYTEYGQPKESGVTRPVKETKYFVIAGENLVEQEYDPYIGTTAYGAVYEWDSSWNEEEKREILSNAIETSELF